MSLQTQIIAIVILLGLSGFFSASEAALLSLSRYKARHLVEQKKFGAKYVKKLKDDPERLLSTILIGNNIVNVAASAMATAIAIALFENNAIGIATGVMTFLILIFSEIIPKTLAARNDVIFSLFAARILWYLSVLMYPAIKLLDYMLKALHKLFGNDKIQQITEEELKTIVKASEEEGSIKEIEKDIVHRVFDFDNTTVRDVMTRRNSMVAVPSTMKVREVLTLPSTKIYSRYPVYEKNKSNIVGIVNIKDMLKCLKKRDMDVAVSHIMRKPFFVFAHKPLDAVLKNFQKRREHMAIVVDEKAQFVGIVTIENILEEIVGEIIDESDKIDPAIQHTSKREWLIKGSTEVEEINAKIPIKIEESDYVDLNSFIHHRLGKTVKTGDEFDYKGFKVIVKDVQGKKVLLARVIRIGANEGLFG